MKEYADGGMNIERDVVGNCPAKCMAWDGEELSIDNKACRKCMHCINVMPKALAPGDDKGAAILIGAKAPIAIGYVIDCVNSLYNPSENGYQIDSTNVILFEDPNLTSALITCEQTSALDLPLKVMVWMENEDVYIGFIDPAFMRKRFMIQDCPEVLEKMTALMVRVVNEAIRRR